MNCQGPGSVEKCMCQVGSLSSYRQVFLCLKEGLSFTSAIVGFLCVVCLGFGLICLWWCVGLVVVLDFFYFYGCEEIAEMVVLH